MCLDGIFLVKFIQSFHIQNTALLEPADDLLHFLQDGHQVRALVAVIKVGVPAPLFQFLEYSPSVSVEVFEEQL